MVKRHQLLEATIGVFPNEADAYGLGNTLCLTLPICVLFQAICDFLLQGIFWKFAHPWRRVIFDSSLYEDTKELRKVLSEPNSLHFLTGNTDAVKSCPELNWIGRRRSKGKLSQKQCISILAGILVCLATIATVLTGIFYTPSKTSGKE